MKKHLKTVITASAVLLSISVFLPLTRFAIVGDVSYNRIANIESYLVILFALSAPAFLYLKQARLLSISLAGVWLTLLFPALKGLFKSTDNSLVGQLSAKANQAMQDFAAELFFNVFEFSWGGYIFVVALLCFTAANLIKFLKP